MKRGDLGVAVIGAGRIGTLRARLAAKHPSVGFLAVSDKDAGRAQALAGVAGANVHSTDNFAMIERPVALFAHLHVNKDAAPEMYGLPIQVGGPIVLA